MKRGEPLQRRTPLSAKSPLVRKTALVAAPTQRSQLHANSAAHRQLPKAKRPRDTGPSKATVLAVLARDGGCCVRCGGALWGVRGQDYSIQHRRARGAGGSRRGDTNQPHNLLAVCGSATSGCHGEIEARRGGAREFGYAIRQCDDPLEVPVVHALHGLIFLDAAGGWSSRPSTSNPTSEEA